MADPKDQIDRRRRQQFDGANPSPAASAQLPPAEPTALAQQQQATQVEQAEQRLAELEGRFRFMGKGHPQYLEMRKQLDEVRAMLKHLRSS